MRAGPDSESRPTTQMDDNYVNLFGVLETAGKELANSERHITDLRDFLGKPMALLRRPTDSDFQNEAVEVFLGRIRLKFVADADGFIRSASLLDPGIHPMTSEDLARLVPEFLGRHGFAVESPRLIPTGIPGRFAIENMTGIPESFSAKVESRSDGIHLVLERPN